MSDRSGAVLSPGPAAHAAGSTALARRALWIVLALAFAGALLGLVAVAQGVAGGAQIPLIASCALFCPAALVYMCRGAPVGAVAQLATIYFTFYLAAGAIIGATGPPDRHTNLFVFLIWFFPLAVFNKLVNTPRSGRRLAKAVLLAPLLVVAALAPRLAAIVTLNELFWLIAYGLSFATFGFTFEIVARYREEVLIERERAESLKAESAVLESISDCFIALDDDLRLTYLNDSACIEFGVARSAVLGRALADAVPQFFPDSLPGDLKRSAAAEAATLLDVPDRNGERWYEMRCFPRPGGLSVYFRNVSLSRAASAKIERLAFYDTLTDLPNRVSLRERLRESLRASLRPAAGALLFIDLDDFKTLNDTLGHDTGDALLQQIATQLTACVRLGDTVARFGGDEFVVLLPSVGEDAAGAADNARAIALKLLSAVRGPYTIGSVDHTTTACIGITLFAEELATIDELLKRADLALYRAKAQGRGSICFYDPAMQSWVATRAALQADLRAALARDEFALFYQPLVDSLGTVFGAEALLRWMHPQRGLVSPTDFIPLAEETGTIVELGGWVLETACAQLARWAQARRTAGLTLAVNVSPRQFRDANFVGLVLDVVTRTAADPTRLKLEITESSAMHNVDETIFTMAALNAHGIEFSLDDFGTGYSSLAYLKRLPLARLKIDRSFIGDIVRNAKDASIVRTLIVLGRNLGLAVVAEGVETEDQRALLEREGCTLYQGYLFSPALPVDAFDAFVAARGGVSDARDTSAADPRSRVPPGRLGSAEAETSADRNVR